MDGKESSRSWFCVLNNPQDLYSGEPQEIAEQALDDWIKDKPTRCGAVAYCISAAGLEHLHLVLEDSNKARFSAIKKVYPKAHIEPTRGTREQAEDYINKRGKFEEKGEQVLYIARFGEIKGCQGSRKDIEIISDYLDAGYTPKEIMQMNFGYRRYEKMIKSAYFDKRSNETKFIRDVKVYWHVGESGTGKSYVANQILETCGNESLYFVNDYENGGFDLYNGEPILFLDEFRGQIRYSTLLSLLDKYKVQVHARYGNVLALWNEVHISSVMPPEMVYSHMVSENREVDTLKQLLRRINIIVYHYKDISDNIFKTFEIPADTYRDYETLRRNIKLGFVKTDNEEIPFNKEKATV